MHDAGRPKGLAHRLRLSANAVTEVRLGDGGWVGFVAREVKRPCCLSIRWIIGALLMIAFHYSEV